MDISFVKDRFRYLPRARAAAGASATDSALLQADLPALSVPTDKDNHVDHQAAAVPRGSVVETCLDETNLAFGIELAKLA
jgi:hypothetical protein